MAFFMFTCESRTSISASIFCDFACSQAVCASITVVGVMTPSVKNVSP